MLTSVEEGHTCNHHSGKETELGHLPLEALHRPFSIYKPSPPLQSNYFSDFYRTHQRETFYVDLRQREKEKEI